jgi:hypothetical protein
MVKSGIVKGIIVSSLVITSCVTFGFTYEHNNTATKKNRNQEVVGKNQNTKNALLAVKADYIGNWEIYIVSGLVYLLKI